MGGLGRFLIVAGLLLVAVGLLLSLAPRVPWLGRLPGDFAFGGKNWKVYLPLGTSLLLSAILSLLLWALGRRRF